MGDWRTLKFREGEGERGMEREGERGLEDSQEMGTWEEGNISDVGGGKGVIQHPNENGKEIENLQRGVRKLKKDVGEGSSEDSSLVDQNLRMGLRPKSNDLVANFRRRKVWAEVVSSK